MYGYYIQGNYHFMPEFLKKLAPSHFSDASTFTAIVRWEQVDTDTDDRTRFLAEWIGNRRELDRLTLGLNFRPIEDTVFKFNWQFNTQKDATGLTPAGDLGNCRSSDWMETGSYFKRRHTSSNAGLPAAEWWGAHDEGWAFSHVSYSAISFCWPGFCGCASMSGMQERFAVCSYDQAWDAALRCREGSLDQHKDKDAGLIVTGWLEIPMPGRTFGILRTRIPGQQRSVPSYFYSKTAGRCDKNLVSRRAATLGFSRRISTFRLGRQTLLMWLCATCKIASMQIKGTRMFTHVRSPPRFCYRSAVLATAPLRRRAKSGITTFGATSRKTN